MRRRSQAEAESARALPQLLHQSARRIGGPLPPLPPLPACSPEGQTVTSRPRPLPDAYGADPLDLATSEIDRLVLRNKNLRDAHFINTWIGQVAPRAASMFFCIRRTKRARPPIHFFFSCPSLAFSQRRRWIGHARHGD
jgi:hypothetical protein